MEGIQDTFFTGNFLVSMSPAGESVLMARVVQHQQILCGMVGSWWRKEYRKNGEMRKMGEE